MELSRGVKFYSLTLGVVENLRLKKSFKVLFIFIRSI